jgi:hypothetical protein
LTISGRDGTPIAWYPVEPSLTHCADIRSIEFDIKSGRTSEALRDDDLETFKSGQPWLWQRIQMTLVAQASAEDAPGVAFLDTSITFRNVVMFHFQEFEFGGGSVIEDVMSQGGDSIFHKESLTKEAGFFVTGEISSYGAFCLWVCDNSPLVDRVISRWKTWTSLEGRQSVFRHYQISCDDLGTFHIVCTRADVKRLDRSLNT